MALPFNPLYPSDTPPAEPTTAECAEVDLSDLAALALGGIGGFLAEPVMAYIRERAAGVATMLAGAMVRRFNQWLGGEVPPHQEQAGQEELGLQEPDPSAVPRVGPARAMPALPSTRPLSRRRSF